MFFSDEKKAIALEDFYELFYWEKPDFEDDNCDEKFHCMMRLLEYYMVYLSNSGFSINSTIRHFPFSHDIQDYIDILRKGEVDEEAKIKEEAIMKIQTISIILHEKAKERNCDYFEFIKSISIIIHINKQVLPGREGKDITKIDYVTNEEKDIDEILTLVKSIDNKINDNLKKMRNENE